MWATRLRIAGFEIERHWDYFSPAALGALEWGHYFGLPAAICKVLFGRWIVAPWRFNLWLTLALIRRHYNEPTPQERGAYTFYVTRRAQTRAGSKYRKRAMSNDPHEPPTAAGAGTERARLPEVEALIWAATRN